MHAQPHSIKERKLSRMKKTSASNSLQIKRDAESTKALPVESLKKAIAYFYLVSYCPPGRIDDFRRLTDPLRKALAESAGMNEADYFKAAVPEVCRRIVAFHEGTRQPSSFWVDALVNTARNADESPQRAFAFQMTMANVARLKQRALPENRLHRKKGCHLCRLPCHYGYFSLVSDPRFGQLQEMLAAEVKKPASEQSPLDPVYGFAIRHIAELTGTQEGFLAIEHLVNLSYCLLMLGMAKSRLAIPEEQLHLFQTFNQEIIQQVRM
jgi:hypothetical protein